MAEPDEIYERYLARAIKAMNALGDEVTDADDADDPASAPVLGSGHPLADIMLLKARPRPAEVQEGVAFFGRAGSAILKSVTRVGIDPLVIYGTNCAKRTTDDLEAADGLSAQFLLREIHITEPKIIITPNIDESLDDDAAKRRFWKAFQELGRWYAALPPY